MGLRKSSSESDSIWGIEKSSEGLSATDLFLSGEVGEMGKSLAGGGGNSLFVMIGLATVGIEGR